MTLISSLTIIDYKTYKSYLHIAVLPGSCVFVFLYCFCIPRDMNHPISDNFNNNTFYVMLTHSRLKISFLGYKPFGYRFPSIWKHSSAMDRRWIADGSPMDR